MQVRDSLMDCPRHDLIALAASVAVSHVRSPLARLRHSDMNYTTIELSAVQRTNRILSGVLRTHFHEGKSACFSCLAVTGYLCGHNLSVCGEKIGQLTIGG